MCVLNEVLSLNAQELIHHSLHRRMFLILNEVLSLNAQECEDLTLVKRQDPPQ